MGEGEVDLEESSDGSFEGLAWGDAVERGLWGERVVAGAGEGGDAAGSEVLALPCDRLPLVILVAGIGGDDEDGGIALGRRVEACEVACGPWSCEEVERIVGSGAGCFGGGFCEIAYRVQWEGVCQVSGDVDAKGAVAEEVCEPEVTIAALGDTDEAVIEGAGDILVAGDGDDADRVVFRVGEPERAIGGWDGGWVRVFGEGGFGEGDERVPGSGNRGELCEGGDAGGEHIGVLEDEAGERLW